MLPLLCVLMAVLIVIISLTTMSFSWFEPGTAQGIGLKFVDSSNIRAEKCEINTFVGSKDQNANSDNFGKINYNNEAVDDQVISNGEVGYYKTVITNNSEIYDTVVSLYLASLSATGDSTTYGLGVASPTNTYRNFNTTKADIHIIRNAYISNENGKRELSVEWFIKCGTGEVRFNPSDIYLMYN
ncbi:MAG: hypothetical protein IJ433_01185 [Ruminococcus sp.]|nr:hypothetical protein [Ruminococcus sp.]